jgi:hypothetical protein
VTGPAGADFAVHASSPLATTYLETKNMKQVQITERAMLRRADRKLADEGKHMEKARNPAFG